MKPAYDQEMAANLERAEQSIEAAKELAGNGFYDFAASRAYYAAFYGATAILLNELSAIIAAFIHQHHQETQDYVTRDEIAAALLQNPKSRAIIEARYQNSDHDYDWHAGNLVDWFSSHFTSELSEYVDQFERQKIDHKWAYKPAGGRVG